MKNLLFDVIISMVNEWAKEKQNKQINLEEVLQELELVRNQIEIESDQFDPVYEPRKCIELQVQSRHGLRHYSKAEIDHLGVEGINLLSFFEKSGIISPAEREAAINEVMALDARTTINLHHLKVIIITIVEDNIANPRERAWIEHLFFADPEAYPVQ